ncbi:MAG: SGNH/GDSL hydrolase family protein [Candidatus Omnitrophica bacterium]|nr:SGNH/GDSL hydrolase family protein [Candidatus Omnitrophota bacterium]
MRKAAQAVILVAIPFVFIVFVVLTGEFIMRFVFVSWKNSYEEVKNFQYAQTTRRGDFREGNVFPRKKNGAFRILALGDSYTWGVGIRNTADTWPQDLKKELTAYYTAGPGIDVLNMGKEAFTTFNEYELLNHYGWGLFPDLIILQFTLNDPLPSGPDFARPTSPENLLSIKNLVPSRALHAWLTEHSIFYIFLNGQFRDIQLALFHPYYQRELYREDYPGWRQCKLALMAIAKEARDHNTKVVLVIFPDFVGQHQTYESYPYTECHRKVKAMGAVCGFYVIDLLDVFIDQGKNFRDWHVMKFDFHPNEAACRIAAREIADCIIKNNLIPGSYTTSEKGALK